MTNLLAVQNEAFVQKTGLSKKITINGTTKAYPVYKVRLDMLFYNDQNDRIATWISQYKSENGIDSFVDLDREEFNSIIERFIVQSNEAAIEKTQLNISLVNQREPGVTLSDGRIIDGNRRFTCLRRLSKENTEFNWFETVILETSIESDRKQIKMLELAIQHGEEKKVDYNPIDRLVGVYQDIIDTELLTIEEYADSTNETVFEVKKRVESALLLAEFLEFIHMPKQWHIARDYQVVNIITELQPLLRKCSTEEMREKVKKTVFANVMMKTITDGRKYVRNLSQMMDNGFFMSYIKEQERIGTVLVDELNEENPTSKKELERFVTSHEEAAEDLQVSLDKSLLKAKKQETRSRPSQIVSKSISMLKDVDTNIFDNLTELEKENLRSQLSRLSTVVDRIDTMVSDDIVVRDDDVSKKEPATIKAIEEKEEVKTRFYIAKRHIDEPFVSCLSEGKAIANLSVTLEFALCRTLTTQKDSVIYKVFFIDEANEVISDVKEINLKENQNEKVAIALFSKASTYSSCFLALQSGSDGVDELQQLIPFNINISFAADFDL